VSFFRAFSRCRQIRRFLHQRTVIGVQGYRIDDVKCLSTEFLLPNSKSIDGKFAVGESFDGNRILVNGWIFNPTGMKGRPSAFDFPLKFVLNSVCGTPGGFNMADLDGTDASLAGTAESTLQLSG
jgi:hypothetical protein